MGRERLGRALGSHWPFLRYILPGEVSHYPRLPEGRELVDFDDATRDERWIDYTQLLLNSYAKWLGRELVPRDGSPEVQATRVFDAPFVVVAHGAQPDPILCYANRAALALWEMDLPTMLSTPSRLTAEPLHRDERAKLLARTTRDGYVDDYRGIRISSTGKRFEIERAIVWNLLDAQGEYQGQAATFADWTPLA